MPRYLRLRSFSFHGQERSSTSVVPREISCTLPSATLPGTTAPPTNPTEVDSCVPHAVGLGPAKKIIESRALVCESSSERWIQVVAILVMVA